MTQNEHLLLRQVNPSWIQQGRFSSQTFSPTPKDGRLLSVYDGHLIDAQMSYIHFTTQQRLNSAGVVGLSTNEVCEAELSWRPEPEAFAEHAVIDFSALPSKNLIKAKASRLAEQARIRGWLYQPT